MTRKDYETIAQAIQETLVSYNVTGRDVMETLVEILVDSFQQDNPRFTPNRFRAACLND